MTKTLYILSTLAVMLVVSRFVVRIVDATVQIDNDIGIFPCTAHVETAVCLHI